MTAAARGAQTLRARFQVAQALLGRWLDIDDWQDDLVAPRELVADTRELLSGESVLLRAAERVAPAKRPRFCLGEGGIRQGELPGTVQDLERGLEWQTVCDGKARGFSEAEAYCRDLRLRGKSDWRLPTRAELLSLVDDTRHSPATFEPFQAGTPTDSPYWASTPVAGAPGYAWGVHFHDGGSSLWHRDDRYGFVRAVRSVSPSPGQ